MSSWKIVENSDIVSRSARRVTMDMLNTANAVNPTMGDVLSFPACLACVLMSHYAPPATDTDKYMHITKKK